MNQPSSNGVKIPPSSESTNAPADRLAVAELSRHDSSGTGTGAPRSRRGLILAVLVFAAIVVTLLWQRGRDKKQLGENTRRNAVPTVNFINATSTSGNS